MNEPLSADFDGLGDRAWLNTAHQGAIPRRAADAGHAAIERKRSPWRMAPDSWQEVPRRVRTALARLLAARTQDIVLATSASYGLELLARTLPLDDGDEVLLVEGDFPATVYPWLPLRDRGIAVRLLAPETPLDADRLAGELGSRTRVFCSSWVFSFSGRALDPPALGQACSANGTTFILNATQAIGTRTAAVDELRVDALVCSGFKWLCGPYATGFAWLSPGLRDRLTYRPAYWLAHQSAGPGGLEQGATYELADLEASAYDLTDTANFFNFETWAESLELILELGIERIEAHNQRLVQELIDGIAESPLDLLSPATIPDRSTLVFTSHPAPERNADLFRDLSEVGVHVALRAGSLRFSPHLYNDSRDIGRALEVLRR